MRAGGLPDWFHVLTTPPPQLRHSPARGLAHLAALAAWLDLPLRPEKPAHWNRRWFGEAVRLHARRAGHRQALRDDPLELLGREVGGDERGRDRAGARPGDVRGRVAGLAERDGRARPEAVFAS